jgi:hypothetical protein
MGCPSDKATQREESDRALSLALRKAAGPAATGACLYCTTPLPDGRRWCDADCRDDWQSDQQRGNRS